MKRFIPILIICAIISIFFAPVITRNKFPIPADTIVGLYHPYRDLYARNFPNGISFKNFLITDPVRQQYPWKFLALETEKKMELPLWNPYNFAGTPLLGNFQSSPFYPLNVLLFIMPFEYGWSFLVMLQMVLAGVFLYLYLKNLKLTTYSSLLGAICFSFCGFSVAWLEWGTIGSTAVWLPLILLSTDKILLNSEVLEKSKIKNQKSKLQFINKNLVLWHLILVISLASSFFAGHLQTFFYLFLVSASYFSVRVWQTNVSKKLILVLLLLTFLFLIITLIQWLPTLQFISLSARGIDQNWQQAGWFIPWQNLIQFLAPDFFGNPTTLNYWGVWNYAEFAGYIGIFPLILSAFALSYRRDKKTLFFGIVLLLSLTFSLPTVFAKLPFIFQVPFLSMAQPTRLLFLTDFALAVLAALGCDLLFRHGKTKHVVSILLFFIIIFAVLWIFILFGGRLLSGISPENLVIVKRNLYFPTAIFSFIVVLLSDYIFVKSKKYRTGIVILLVLVTVFDLLRFADKFTPFTLKQYLFPSTKTIAFLQNQPGQFRTMATDSRILPPNFSIIYHLQTLDGYDPLYLLRYGELIAASERQKPDINPPFGFNRIITPHNYNSRLVDLLGVKFVLSLSDIKSEKLQKVFEEGQTKVYKNTNAFDRVFLVKNIKSAENKNETIKLMYDENVDLKKSAIVDNWDSSKIDFATGSASIVEYKDNSVTVSTQSQGESFLVLVDTFYPTWHARICEPEEIGCKDAKIYQTDYNFRGVVVPKGIHRVIFEDRLL